MDHLTKILDAQYHISYENNHRNIKQTISIIKGTHVFCLDSNFLNNKETGIVTPCMLYVAS
jgi:hypothetical protein